MAEGKEKKGFFKRLVEGLSKQEKILFRELTLFSADIPVLTMIFTKKSKKF